MIIQTRGSVFRTLVPIDRLMKDEIFRKWSDAQPPGFFSAYGQQSTAMVTYPCRNGELMNIAVFHPTREHLKDAREWSHPATKEDVLEVMKGWPDVWRNIINAADDDGIKVYRVEQRESISTLVNGKTILVGDAAHGMLPTYAQGGAMGIEDVAALEVLLAGLGSNNDLRSRLSLWDELRRPRSFTIQYISNKRQALIAEGGISAAERDPTFRSFFRGPKLPALELDVRDDAWNDVLFAYDVRAEANKALRDGNLNDVQYFGTGAGNQGIGEAKVANGTSGAVKGGGWF